MIQQSIPNNKSIGLKPRISQRPGDLVIQLFLADAALNIEGACPLLPPTADVQRDR